MEEEKPKNPYEQEKQGILEKYWKRYRRILIGSLISILAAGSLTLSSSTIEKNKLKNLRENSLTYQEYIDNQQSLMYLENKLEQYKAEKLPEFLSQEVRNELEKISIQEDSAKIFSLEKLVGVVEQENNKIINNPKLKEYLEKEKRIENKWDFFYFLGLGLILFSLPGCSLLSNFNTKRKYEELKALDKRYGVIKSSQ